MKYATVSLVLALAIAAAGCEQVSNFGADTAFLQKHTDAIVLSNSAGNAKVLVVPQYQGRVMTSTADGDEGASYGWINYEAVASGKTVPHINVYGGEERFWMGPEGGQYSIFFPQGVKFEFADWQTPAVIDTESFETVIKKANSATFTKRTRLVNYSGTVFDIQIDRTVKLLGTKRVNGLLGIEITPAVKMVAYATNNSITNISDKAWSKETGLLSIWLLGMFKHSPETTIVIPFEAGPVEELGAKVKDDYFGKVPADRLVVKDDVLFFSGDGQYRSKIGINAHRAKKISGSYDATQNILTLVHFDKPKGLTDYVNSMWAMQDEPYAGDVVNSYNDGPVDGGKPLGPFYELETSSAAKELGPGKKVRHVQRTIHFQGPVEDLDRIARETLGVSIEEITTAIPK